LYQLTYLSNNKEGLVVAWERGYDDVQGGRFFPAQHRHSSRVVVYKNTLSGRAVVYEPEMLVLWAWSAEKWWPIVICCRSYAYHAQAGGVALPCRCNKRLRAG